MSTIKIGIDIRNIGKKRTGDEAVFFGLVKALALISDTSNLRAHTNATKNKNIKFYLFTDIDNEKVLKNIKRDLGIERREDFEVVSLKTPSLILPIEKGKKLFNNKFIWNVWTLPRYLRKHPVDVYHTQYITPFFVSKKIKIITHIHDVSFKAYKRFIKWSDLFFLKILIPLSLKRADKIIAVSKFTKYEIVKYYKVNPGKAEVVYNAVSSLFGKGRVRERFEKREKKGNTQISNSFQITLNPPFLKGEKLKEKYGLPEKFILYIGTLQPRKNIPMLIKAYVKIKNKIPDIKLVIAGNREARNFDKKIYEVIESFQIPPNPPFPKGENSGDIIFPGFIEEKDKMDLIAMAHLFVFPSLYEGFGIPILEAMSRNVPVAASDIPSLSEVGDNAYAKFNPRGLDEMAKILYTACINKSLRKKLINLGQSRARFFSWEKSAKKMLEIYKKLASHKKI